MGVFHNFILSTTPTLDGYKIKKYFGTVTSHVVTGTGLFSDIAAEFRDVFGGRSASYQKQLISVKEEVFKKLKEEATALGANGIVGLRVDFDEVSGKGKTMFMVSALGTAVQIEFMGNKEEADLQSSGLSQVVSDKLNLEIEKLTLIKSLGTPRIDYLQMIGILLLKMPLQKSLTKFSIMLKKYQKTGARMIIAITPFMIII